MNNNKKNADLTQRIRSYISRNRSSISNEDLVLLEECIKTLEDSQKRGMSLDLISKVLSILGKVLSDAFDIIDNLH